MVETAKPWVGPCNSLFKGECNRLKIVQDLRNRKYKVFKVHTAWNHLNLPISKKLRTTLDIILDCKAFKRGFLENAPNNSCSNKKKTQKRPYVSVFCAFVFYYFCFPSVPSYIISISVLLHCFRTLTTVEIIIIVHIYVHQVYIRLNSNQSSMFVHNNWFSLKNIVSVIYPIILIFNCFKI